MDQPKGVFEELIYKNKLYPDNQHTYALFPQQYSQAFIQHIMKDLSQTFQQFAEAGQYSKILELVQQLKVITNTGDQELQLPIKAIHYRHDDGLLPRYPELFLSHPSLLTNTDAEQLNLFKTLKYELQTADQVNFMVSFIRWSGLQLLIRAIDDFRKIADGRKLRILTSTYLKITEPKALWRLLEIPNVETRVFDSGNVSFHTKAYLFARQSGLNTAIIGSSNLSYSALQTGYEWNVKLPDVEQYSIYNKAKKAFDLYWEDERALPLSEVYIREYEKEYTNKKIMLVNPYVAAEHVDMVDILKDSPQDQSEIIVPNAMQRKALEALQQTRLNGHDKGVVIAATGTGKTYLSAFDAHQFGAGRLLFIAHRDEILESAKKTFIDVFGHPEAFGKLTGYTKEMDKPFLFSTVQSMSRDGVLGHFAQDYFDYVVIDEFHHAEAATYRKVIEHFRPKFLLGLTATPERMDGQDVLALCDHNVVYEIRLRDALKEGLLAPFRYFGLSDPTVNYDQVELRNGQFVEQELVRALNTHERVDYVIEMIEKFGYDGSVLRALGFCATIEHAKYMSEEFNQRGYQTEYLTGNDAPERRQEVITRLESKEDSLQIIFTVNIFNEGIDIPKLNVILFLRPTESATIFIQQLGRGLRKIQGKEYVTVLDFIGNYHKSFIVPLALSGQNNHKAFDRDSLRVAIETEFADLPDGCFVDLEEISRQQILHKIDSVRMDKDLMLMDMYNQFAKELGRSPEIHDFLYVDGAPSIHYFISKYGSWVETKRKMRDLGEWEQQVLDDIVRLQIIRRLEGMLPLKWPYEFSILSVALTHGKVSVADVITELQYRFALVIDIEQHQSKIERAMQKLASALQKQNWSFGELIKGTFALNPQMAEILNDGQFYSYFMERLEYGFTEFRRIYRPHSFFDSSKSVVLYQNYTRNDLIYLFESDAKVGSWREGVSRVGDHYLLFINLNKGEKVADHLMYHDYFVDQQEFHWQSQNDTSHDSTRGQEYIHQMDRGIHIHLFIRKFKEIHNKTLPFMYFGEIDYVRSHGDKPMNITWRLHEPVPDEIYRDLNR